MIEVERLTKAYEDRLAVRDLSLSVAGGEILGLVGPNGAGKTTTLRALAGIHSPTSGTLRIAGHDVVAKPLRAKAKLAMIADDPQLFASLTVWEHLEFTAQVYRVANFAPRATELLEQFELLDRRDTLADELSRGMRQKVAVACAFLHDPVALLLDEPMTGLDPRGIRSLFDSLRERAASGAAIIISSHLLSQIDQLCSRFLILNEGQSLFLGSRAEIGQALPGLRDDASLEEIFFEVTEGKATTDS